MGHVSIHAYGVALVEEHVGESLRFEDGWRAVKSILDYFWSLGVPGLTQCGVMVEIFPTSNDHDGRSETLLLASFTFSHENGDNAGMEQVCLQYIGLDCTDVDKADHDLWTSSQVDLDGVFEKFESSPEYSLLRFRSAESLLIAGSDI